MPDIYTQTFWDEDDDELWQEIAETVVVAYMGGVAGGVNVLPRTVQVLADWDGINANALEFAKKYRFSWIKDINDVTRRQTQKAVSDWISSGSPLDALEKSLESIFGEARAERIAATEVTRIFAEANAEAWKSTGLVNKVRFNTVEDDRVCELCSPLDGEQFDVDDYGHKPPIHVNCRCFNTPVVSEEALGRRLDEVLA